MRRVSAILGLLAAVLACAGPVAAQRGDAAKGKLLAASADQLIGYALDCMAEAKAPSASVPSWLGERHVAAAPRKPRLLIAGFDRRVSPVTPGHQDSTEGLLLDRVSKSSDIDLVRLSELGWRLDLVMDSFGQGKSREIAKQFDATKVDFIVKLDGRYAAGGRRLLVRAILQRLDGTCYKQSEEEALTLDQFDQTHLTPREIFRDAVGKVFAAHKDIRRLVILRTLHGVSPLDTKVAGPLEEELKSLAEAAGGPPGGSQQSSQLKAGSDGPGAPKGVAVFRLGKGERPPSGTGGQGSSGDWIARISVNTSGDEPALSVEFMSALGKERIKSQPATVSSQLVNVRAPQPSAELMADPILPAGSDNALEFSVAVRRPSSVYCAMQDLDGDTSIIYPTSASKPATVLATGHVMKFPQVEAAPDIRTPSPGRTLIRCLAVPKGLPRPLDQRWRDQFHSARVDRKLAGHMTGAEFAELLEELGSGRETYETETLVHIVPPPR